MLVNLVKKKIRGSIIFNEIKSVNEIINLRKHILKKSFRKETTQRISGTTVNLTLETRVFVTMTESYLFKMIKFQTKIQIFLKPSIIILLTLQKIWEYSTGQINPGTVRIFSHECLVSVTILISK